MQQDIWRVAKTQHSTGNTGFVVRRNGDNTVQKNKNSRDAQSFPAQRRCQIQQYPATVSSQRFSPVSPPAAPPKNNNRCPCAISAHRIAKTANNSCIFESLRKFAEILIERELEADTKHTALQSFVACSYYNYEPECTAFGTNDFQHYLCIFAAVQVVTDTASIASCTRDCYRSLLGDSTSAAEN